MACGKWLSTLVLLVMCVDNIFLFVAGVAVWTVNMIVDKRVKWTE
ncbi:hypothetical protein [Phocaeicola sartorii]|nr:hypothetical protein [Phocaeicola sartorii]